MHNLKFLMQYACASHKNIVLRDIIKGVSFVNSVLHMQSWVLTLAAIKKILRIQNTLHLH